MKKQQPVKARSNPISRNTPEKLRYFYHPDHIGSTSWVTDSAKNGIQYCEYLPYGEPFLDQRSTTWNSRYTFSGKERDNETGYSYFGARYYNSDISIWLSVDPLSDKYPNLTAYAYCGNNPIILVDPDGRTVFIDGDAATEATNKIAETNKNLIISRNNKTGKLSASIVQENGTDVALTDNEQKLYDAIQSSDVIVNLTVNETNFFQKDGAKYKSDYGGAFLGNKLAFDKDGKAVFAFTMQFASMNLLKENYFSSDVGGVLTHEITESYLGGLISLQSGTPASIGAGENKIYDTAHNEASSCPKMKSTKMTDFYQKTGINMKLMKENISKFKHW